MDLRLALYDLAARHRLDAAANRRLQALAGLDAEPAALARLLPRGLAVLAAALGGFGLVMWIAANWDTLGRAGRFAVLMGAIAVVGTGAAASPRARTPLALLAMLGIGALFAFFGQTYQTGADAWQLFALWAVLALPLALGARSDVLWAPWALVAMCAVSLWTHAHLGQRWQVRPQDLPTHAAAWAMALALAAALGPPAARWSGAGAWGFRSAAVLAVVLVGIGALGGLFQQHVAPHYGLGLLVMAGAAAALATRRGFDVFALSAVALGLNTLLVSGLARTLFEGHHGDPIGALLMIGLTAAALLAGSVKGILWLNRRYAGEPGAAQAQAQTEADHG